MTNTERAAEICDPWRSVITIDDHDGQSYRSIVGRTGNEIAEALAAAGLLVTDEIQAVLDAVARWRTGMVEEADIAVHDAWDAYLASRGDG